MVVGVAVVKTDLELPAVAMARFAFLGRKGTITMKSNFENAMRLVLKSEGGWNESEHEHGGAVNRGVTFTVFSAYMAPKAVTFADLKAMDEATAITIYRKQYAAICGFDDLPLGIDYCVLDAAVNGGVSGSIKLLQKALATKSVVIDGRFGLVTRWGAKNRDPLVLVNKLCDLRSAHYQTFKIYGKPVKEGSLNTFGMGWEKRISQVRKAAIAMVNANGVK
jgi:lysozyme family protein